VTTKGDAQRVHRRAAVTVGDLSDGGRLGLRPAEHLEGRETDHHVEKVTGQCLEGLDLAIGPRLRRCADQGHEDGMSGA